MKTSRPRAASVPDLHAELGLRPGQSLALLQALHILTREGRINQDSRRKLKQVNHLVQFIERVLNDLQHAQAGPTPLVVVDHGAGKSYLGFILYDLFFRPRALAQDRVIGVETRGELVQRCTQLAQDWGFSGMRFLQLAAADAAHSGEIGAQVDVVTALHACDTATDDAIAFGLARKVRAMVLVPCCQAEVARHLNQHKALSLSRTPLAELWRHPLHTREVGSQLTNVLRCLYLEANGYRVTVTELVGWEHSMKNELIVAQYTGRKNRSAAQRLCALLEQFGLQELQHTRFTRLPDNGADNQNTASRVADGVA